MLADHDHVAIVQIVPAHALGLHVNAVRAVEILDEAGIDLSDDLTVVPADELAVDLQIVILSSADHDSSRPKLALEQGLAAAGEQNPADGMSGLRHTVRRHLTRG